jgi:hypothetical protein
MIHALQVGETRWGIVKKSNLTLQKSKSMIISMKEIELTLRLG